MEIVTDRLILREWRHSDAESLFKFASDARVGPIAGWPPHKSIEESAAIIRDIFMQPGVFAVTLKGDDTAVGCIGVLCGGDSNFSIPDNEGEISYWLGVPYWGKGLTTEAVEALIRYSFETLRLKRLWCGYFDGNERSWRVQQKSGFRHHHTCPPQYYALIGETRIEHVTCLEKNSSD